MLFLLAMEPMYILFKKAQEMGLLSSLSKGRDSFRISLYVDDAVVFIKPTQHDLKVLLILCQSLQKSLGSSPTWQKLNVF
jgi:hypothetical protein